MEPKRAVPIYEACRFLSCAERARMGPAFAICFFAFSRSARAFIVARRALVLVSAGELGGSGDVSVGLTVARTRAL